MCNHKILKVVGYYVSKPPSFLLIFKLSSLNILSTNINMIFYSKELTNFFLFLDIQKMI